MIPMHTSISIIKSDDLDVWGKPIAGETIDLKGNLRSQTKVVTNTNGEEVVSYYTILFEGFVDIRHADKVCFIEPNGEEKILQPIVIKFMRNLDGTVAFTKVEA